MADEDELKRARYSEVERRLWNDARFRSLSPFPPCGRGLWLYLLTTPELGAMPGIIVMGEAAMAEHLEWPLEGFRKAFAEVSSKGMVEADWKARLVVIFKAVGRRKPQSPNVVRSWRQQWFEVPECELKIRYYRQLKAYVEALGEGFAKAFGEAIADPSPNQDQDQDQKQEQKQRARERAPPAAAAPRVMGADEQRIRDAIRAEPEFSDLDADALAGKLYARSLTGVPLERGLEAIRDCAAHVTGVGLNRETKQRKLFGYWGRGMQPGNSQNRRQVQPPAVGAPTWTEGEEKRYGDT